MCDYGAMYLLAYKDNYFLLNFDICLLFFNS